MYVHHGTYNSATCYVHAVAALHDMGGRTEFFGPVERERHEPVFHEAWESRVFGMSWFLLPLFGGNIDALRLAQERQPRDIYLLSYYRRWLGGFETMLVDAGYLGSDEVDARLAGRTAEPGRRRASRMRRDATARILPMVLRPQLPRWLAAFVIPRVMGGTRPGWRRARFSVGESIRVCDRRQSGHTRQPGYVTGKPGVIVAHHGSVVFPDARAVGKRARPQHLYTVAFDGRQLWGDAAEPATEVRVDLFEPYLQAA